MKLNNKPYYIISHLLLLFSPQALAPAFNSKITRLGSFTLLFFILSQSINSQSAGDLAFIGWNSDGNDDVVFILMADFSANTKIYVRDDEYNSGWDGTGEGTISWTVPLGGSSEGTMVEINNASAVSPTVNTGTVTREDAGFNISNSENAVYAYISDNTFNSGSFTFLGGFCNATSTSELTGTGLTDDIDFWSWGNKDNWKYTGSTSSSSVSDMKTNLRNSSNWTNSDGSGDQSYDFTFNDFSLPVELLYFSAIPKNGNVLLKWVTESEVENLGFILERNMSSSVIQWTEIASFITHSELQGQGSVTYRTDYEFIDRDVAIGKTYDYRLSDVDYFGVKTDHPISSVTVTPPRIVLHKPWPNPFNPVTQFSIFVYKESQVSIKIFDSLGRKITTLVDSEIYSPGTYPFSWDGLTGLSQEAGSGIYYVSFESGEDVLSEKILLIR